MNRTEMSLLFFPDDIISTLSLVINIISYAIGCLEQLQILDLGENKLKSTPEKIFVI